jgi:hypothetical protein
MAHSLESQPTSPHQRPSSSPNPAGWGWARRPIPPCRGCTFTQNATWRVSPLAPRQKNPTDVTWRVSPSRRVDLPCVWWPVGGCRSAMTWVVGDGGGGSGGGRVLASGKSDDVTDLEIPAPEFGKDSKYATSTSLQLIIACAKHIPSPPHRLRQPHCLCQPHHLCAHGTANCKIGGTEGTTARGGLSVPTGKFYFSFIFIY